jgi:hypothetical protein
MLSREGVTLDGASDSDIGFIDHLRFSNFILNALAYKMVAYVLKPQYCHVCGVP